MLSAFRPRLTATSAVIATASLDDALKSFENSLDPEQKIKLQTIKAVPDAHDVAKFTHQLDQENAKRQSRCVAARISPLLESVQQFSKVVETFVSSNPQIAALVSGLKLYLSGDERITELITSFLSITYVVNTHCLEAMSDLQTLVGQLVAAMRQDEDLMIGNDRLQKEVVEVLCTASQGM
ncbi:hypothetical protein JADG_000190 [Aureobasidium aubasidani]|nr:hypothetical protein JADG_000190 [Aureobasidium pullulans]